MVLICYLLVGLLTYTHSLKIGQTSDAMASSTNSKDMKNPSIVLYKPGDARVEDRPMPEIEDPHDVLVRIAFVGVCGSDVSSLLTISIGLSFLCSFPRERR